MSTCPADPFAVDDEYHSPDDLPIPRLYRIPLLKTMWFHLGFLFGLLRRSYILASRGQFDEKAFARAGLHYLRHIEKAGGRFHVSGLNNLDSIPGPVVVVANHISHCETFILPAMVNSRKQKSCFVIKNSLSHYPIFGPVVNACKPITVTRKHPRQDFRQVMEQGIERLREGRSVIIFPQTRRKRVFRASEFNTLGEKLAAKAKVPVIPVALRTDFLAPGKIFLDFGMIRPDRPIHFEFGSPLAPSMDPKARHGQIIEFISSRLTEWGVPCQE